MQTVVKLGLDATELRAIAKEPGTSAGKVLWLLDVPTPVITDHLGLAFYIPNELDFVRYLY